MRLILFILTIVSSLTRINAEIPTLGIPKIFSTASVPSISTNQATLPDRASALIEMELIDRISTTHLFRIMGENDLEEALKTLIEGHRSNSDITDPKFLTKIREAGVKYLLITTLEDAQDQTARLGTRTASTITTTQNSFNQNQLRFQPSRPLIGGPVYLNRQAVNHTFSVNQQTQATMGRTVTERQQLHISLACKIFDADSGALLESASHSITTNRVAEVLDEPAGRQISEDLLRAAAKTLATWEASKLVDVTFPVKVVATETNIATINRGQGSQARLGQVYWVKSLGKDLKDPDTGQSLGREENTVGKVRITEIGPRFSKALILENQGIVVGAVLRSIDDK